MNPFQSRTFNPLGAYFLTFCAALGVLVGNVALVLTTGTGLALVASFLAYAAREAAEKQARDAILADIRKAAQQGRVAAIHDSRGPGLTTDE